MIIGNRKTGLKRILPRGVFPINIKTINNLPKIKLFIEDTVNENIRDVCKQLLTDAMTRKDAFRHGEVGYLIKVNDDSSIAILYKAYGDYIHIPLSTMNSYKNIIKSCSLNDNIIFIHSHPNNSDFSFGDFSMLVNTDVLKSILAIGNRGRICIMSKDYQNKSLYNNMLNNIVNEANKICKDKNNPDDVRHCRDYVFSNYLSRGIMNSILNIKMYN